MRRVDSPAGLTWFESELLTAAGARAAFSSRTGGASSAPFDALNLGPGAGDDPAAVAGNRRSWFAALGLDPAAPACGRQTHGANVVEVRAGDRGRGTLEGSAAFPDCDGLLTVERGQPLFCLSADCALVAMAAPGGSGCAVVHAGWRGLAAGIVERGAGLLAAAAGCRPGELRAFVGAMLGGECFAVREDFVEALRSAWGREEAGRFLLRGESGGTRFRYQSAVERRLDIAGIARQNVEGIGLCTACRPELFYSHRASGGRTGRMAMTVWLPATQ